MNLNQLHYFVTLAYMEHYTKSGESNYLSRNQASVMQLVCWNRNWGLIYLKNKDGT